MSLVLLSKLILRNKIRTATKNDNSFLDYCKDGITAIENSISDKRAKTKKKEVF